MHHKLHQLVVVLITFSVSAAQTNLYKEQKGPRVDEVAELSAVSDLKVLEDRSAMVSSQDGHGHGDNVISHDPEDELMVYETPRDYATWARQERDRRVAEGDDPDSIILQSEVCNHVSRRDGESPADFAKRYAETMNSMIRRGVTILNDQGTADVVASGFWIADGRYFDLGPGSGATKKEFREFCQWFAEASKLERVEKVPERWLRFEKQAEERFEL